MSFTPITTEKYIKLHLKNNPGENEKQLRSQLQRALTAYHNGVKCSCGNDIWVVGSAIAGNSCFTCITGESNPNDNYEIAEAIRKQENRKGCRHIDDIDPAKIAGFFSDDGYEINPHSIPTPGLCLICKRYDIHDPEDENLLCAMNRWDQRDEDEFKCGVFEKKGG